MECAYSVSWTEVLIQIDHRDDDDDDDDDEEEEDLVFYATFNSI